MTRRIKCVFVSPQHCTITVFMLNSSIDCDQTSNVIKCPLWLQYWETSILTSIVAYTRTYSDICKWWVALVRQEEPTRSRPPLFICSLYGWQIHFAMFFYPFCYFSPYWLSMKVLYWSEWCHILVGDKCHFAFFYFNVVSFHVCWLSWHGIFYFAWVYSKSWCCVVFCFTFFFYSHVVCMKYVVCDSYLFCRNIDYGLMDNDFVCLTFD